MLDTYRLKVLTTGFCRFGGENVIGKDCGRNNCVMVLLEFQKGLVRRYLVRSSDVSCQILALPHIQGYPVTGNTRNGSMIPPIPLRDMNLLASWVPAAADCKLLPLLGQGPKCAKAMLADHQAPSTIVWIHETDG